jgi:hypothetical protein
MIHSHKPLCLCLPTHVNLPCSCPSAPVTLPHWYLQNHAECNPHQYHTCPSALCPTWHQSLTPSGTHQSSLCLFAFLSFASSSACAR